MPEVAGDAALFLDPNEPEATARQLLWLLEDDEARRQWSERARRRAAAFTWEACAKCTIGAYRAALQAGQE